MIDRKKSYASITAEINPCTPDALVPYHTYKIRNSSIDGSTIPSLVKIVLPEQSFSIPFRI